MKSTLANNPSKQDAIGDIIAYHDRTKHHPERYANGPGGIDWANQPDPFRRFNGAPAFRLPLAGPDDTPPAAALFGAAPVTSQPFTLKRISLYLELSLGLSARKEIATSSWYLRMNPSSGNLHPTEAYAILPGLEGLPGGAGVYHYAPLEHNLEQRARWPQRLKPDASGFHMGLTSIIWREAWKYGERAFRYCQHDVGHALAALRFAAAALGWRVQLLPEWDDARLARLLGLDRVEDFADAEQETPELLVRVIVNEAATTTPPPATDTAVAWFGRANQLSHFHIAWPVIDEAIAVSERKGASAKQLESGEFIAWPPPSPPVCGHSAGQLIRQRRRAVNFDGVSSISQETFLAILDTTLPRTNTPPFDAWPYPPRLHLVLMVHRVTGLDPGLYLWLRTPTDAEALRRAFGRNLNWEAVTDSTVKAQLAFELLEIWQGGRDEIAFLSPMRWRTTPLIGSSKTSLLRFCCGEPPADTPPAPDRDDMAMHRARLIRIDPRVGFRLSEAKRAIEMLATPTCGLKVSEKLFENNTGGGRCLFD